MPCVKKHLPGLAEDWQANEKLEPEPRRELQKLEEDLKKHLSRMDRKVLKKDEKVGVKFAVDMLKEETRRATTVLARENCVEENWAAKAASCRSGATEEDVAALRPLLRKYVVSCVDKQAAEGIIM